MCLRRAPEKYIAGAKAPVGAALDRAGIDGLQSIQNCEYTRRMYPHHIKVTLTLL
jgi:hypothetical protein